MLQEHKILGDHRGQLIAIESEKQIPFEIKRVFYIYGTLPDVPRGNHSHYKTKQYLVAVAGSCKVTLDDGRGSKKTYDLDVPHKGLFQDAMIWGVMHSFTSDCVLLVLADSHYDESDYIRDYTQFFNLVNGGA